MTDYSAVFKTGLRHHFWKHTHTLEAAFLKIIMSFHLFFWIYLIPFTLPHLSSSVSRLSRLPRVSSFHFSHSPAAPFLIHHFAAIFHVCMCVLVRDRQPDQDGLRQCLSLYSSSFVFNLLHRQLVFTLREGKSWDRKAMPTPYSVVYLGRLPVKSISLLHY